MILISHRGNIYNRIPEKENSPDYIDEALSLGYDVEIDVWYFDSTLWLGHNHLQYKITFDWLLFRAHRLWIHCKNIEALNFLLPMKLNCFYHEKDAVTLTSKKHIWAYPGKQPIKNSIAVLPEIDDEKVSQCAGICSDVISKYK